MTEPEFEITGRYATGFYIKYTEHGLRKLAYACARGELYLAYELGIASSNGMPDIIPAHMAEEERQRAWNEYWAEFTGYAN